MSATVLSVPRGDLDHVCVDLRLAYRRCRVWVNEPIASRRTARVSRARETNCFFEESDSFWQSCCAHAI